MALIIDRQLSRQNIRQKFSVIITNLCFQDKMWIKMPKWCNFILLNGECRCKSAESMLSQKRGYKVNFIFTYLGLVVDVKKIIQTITNRLLDNKEPTKFRLFYWITITDTCLLSQCWVKKGDTKWISFKHSQDLLLKPKNWSKSLPTDYWTTKY